MDNQNQLQLQNNTTNMTAKRLEKLEQRLYRAVNQIRNAKTPLETMKYISRFGILDRQYQQLTGMRFTPAVMCECVQDVQWGYGDERTAN